MKAAAQPTKQPGGSKVKKVLLWSGLTMVVMTALGFYLPHPWRMVPGWLGAAATPVAFVAFCMVVWRMRHRQSSIKAIDDSYKQTLEAMVVGEDRMLRFNQTLAALVFILFAFLAATFALVFNLLHALNVK